MNIFVLDTDPVVAARLHCDRHVVKMPLEAAQILCTALHLHGVATTYKPTHAGHPCVRWAAETRSNFRWLAIHGLALVEEHGIRYAHTAAGRRGHASKAVLLEAAGLAGSIPDGPLTPFELVMPASMRGPDPVASYRRYYAAEKSAIATWRSPRTRPSWMDGE